MITTTWLHDQLAETMFDIYKENYPTIFSFVEKAVQHGYSSKAIRKEFDKKFPGDKLQTYHIELVADHMIGINQPKPPQS